MTQELRHLDELAELPEKPATEIHLDRHNQSVLYFFHRLFVLIAAGLLIGALSGGGIPWPVPVASLALSALLFRWQRVPTLDQRFSRVGFAYLFVQLALFRATYWADSPENPFEAGDFMMVWIVFFFRLSRLKLLLVLAIFWTPITLNALLLRPLDGRPAEFETVFGYSVFLAMIYGISSLLTWRRTRAFARAWQRASEKAQEGRRMRAELDHARRIQLSMLPQVDPYLPWLELAGVSQPASEVGGDYYDYYAPTPDRQAVVVADVAGHGMASGLILAAVRGCLVLLHDQERAPGEILGRLERVVRTLGGRRTFVAMIYAVFDRRERLLRWSSAGMPPIVHFRAADGEVVELIEENLPLGPTLPRQIGERQQALAAGDVLLFPSDGVGETLGGDGSPFGDDRLHAAVRRLAPGATAAELRDQLLAELTAFRGDAETTDDVTLVVARLR